MIHVHDLAGCAPAPLAHYLKALGILRLITEQADKDARGWWEGERFRVATMLDESALVDFFMDHYRPTPMLAPWNGASGFFRTWDKKKGKLRTSKNAIALERLLSQQEDRWNGFRAANSIAVNAVGRVLKEADVNKLSDKERRNLLVVPRGEGPVFPVADKDRDKAAIQRTMTWCCATQQFYRSAVVDMGEDFGYPSLWGSGGNDGAIDFTSRYFENLVCALLDSDKTVTTNWLRSALNSEPANNLLTKAAGKVGQFLPGGAGGANCTTGFGSQHDTQLNPWDFILMLEGAVLFTTHATRRLGAAEQSRAAAPFAVNAQGSGYASAADSDESARGEQWMPLWNRPLTLGELKRLLSEGRAQIGARSVREPLDLARAVARLGAARGIVAFHRYGYIKRNGESNLAVPLGRFRVPDKAPLQLTCLDDIDYWFNRSLRREARDKNAPARLRQVVRRLADALFAVVQHSDEPARWHAVLFALADVEAVLRTGAGHKAQPVPMLRADWVTAANDDSAEFRLALACALQGSAFCKDYTPIDRCGVRRHWLPLDDDSPRKFAVSGSGSQSRIQHKHEVVMEGRSGIDDAIALVTRRLIEASQRGERRLPLMVARGAFASPADLTRFVAGELDVNRVLRLVRALMALDADKWAKSSVRLNRPPSDDFPDDAWLAIRLALLPWPLEDGRRIGTDPAIVRRLDAGDASTAMELARRRLRAAGIRTTVRVASVPACTARLWAAALAFPITQKTATLFLRRLDPNAIQQGDIYEHRPLAAGEGATPAV